MISLFASTEAAIYLLNTKRADLAEIEARYGVRVEVLPEGENEGAKMRVVSSGPRPEFIPKFEPITFDDDDVAEIADDEDEDELREGARMAKAAASAVDGAVYVAVVTATRVAAAMTAPKLRMTRSKRPAPASGKPVKMANALTAPRMAWRRRRRCCGGRGRNGNRDEQVRIKDSSEAAEVEPAVAAVDAPSAAEPVSGGSARQAPGAAAGRRPRMAPWSRLWSKWLPKRRRRGTGRSPGQAQAHPQEEGRSRSGSVRRTGS